MSKATEIPPMRATGDSVLREIWCAKDTLRAVEKANGAAASDRRFLWVGTELAEERDDTGGTVTKRFFGQGEQIAGTAYFFTHDHLGSVREMTDSQGTVRARYDYDPYGRRTKTSGDLESDFGFTGHYFHPASGLHLTLFRAYDAETGRWLSRDPIEEQGGINFYTYAFGDPIRNIDPDGRCVVLVVGLVALGVGTYSAFYKWSKDAELKQTLKKIQEEKVNSGNDGAWGTMGQKWVGEQAATIPDVAQSLSAVGTSVSGFGPPGPITDGADAIVGVANYLTDYEGVAEDFALMKDAVTAKKQPTCQKK